MFLVVGSTSLYNFVELIQQRGAFVRVIFPNAIALIFVSWFIRDFLEARKQQYKYFWGSWMIALFCWCLFMGKMFQESFQTRLIINPKYEALFEKDIETIPNSDKAITAAGNLGASGQRAFVNGDYAYAIKFFDADFEKVGVYDFAKIEEYEPAKYDLQIGLQWPLYAAAKLAVNPTSEGRKQFHESLERLVKYLQTGLDQRKGATLPRFYEDIIGKLTLAKAVLPLEEKKFIDEVIVPQITNIKKAAANKHTP